MFDEAVKSQKSNGTVKSFRCKAADGALQFFIPRPKAGLFTKPSMFKRPLAGKDHGYRRVSFVARLD